MDGKGNHAPAALPGDGAAKQEQHVPQAAGLVLAGDAVRHADAAFPDGPRHWESGRREPLLSAAARLAKALGCSFDELAGLTSSVVNSATPASAAAPAGREETAPQRQVEPDAGKGEGKGTARKR